MGVERIRPGADRLGAGRNPLGTSHDDRSNGFRDLTLGVSARLATLHTGTPDALKSFGDLGRGALIDGVLSRKTKDLLTPALGVAARCDPCIGYQVQTLAKLGLSRRELEETLGVARYMGGGSSLRYAANAIAAFEEFSRPVAA